MNTTSLYKFDIFIDFNVCVAIYQDLALPSIGEQIFQFVFSI